MLLTGGVRTNIFRQATDEIVVMLNDVESLKMAQDFFENQDEIAEVRVGENKNQRQIEL